MRVVSLVVLVALFATGCSHRSEKELGPPPPLVVASVDASAPEPAIEKLVPDEAVGPLLARLSEHPGDFPSENYVSNELSLLDVARDLRDPKLRGRAYVGVGPEQNYTYLALLEPKVAYVVDIRRDNFLEHMFFRGCFEAGATRAEFLSALLARRSAEAEKPDPALRDEGIARTKALLDRLGVVRMRGDDAAIARIQSAFATHGLSIAYTTTETQRDYPSLADMLSLRDPEGHPASFFASEAAYARVRRLVIENRVLPVIGDFGGTHALRAVAADMRDRGALLGVFYASNVEQYLSGRGHRAFVTSVASMPRDDASLLVRVRFDRARAHAQPHTTHPTTQLAIRANALE